MLYKLYYILGDIRLVMELIEGKLLSKYIADIKGSTILYNVLHCTIAILN